jgi:hypothetical protein
LQVIAAESSEAVTHILHALSIDTAAHETDLFHFREIIAAKRSHLFTDDVGAVLAPVSAASSGHALDFAEVVAAEAAQAAAVGVEACAIIVSAAGPSDGFNF